MEARSSKVMGRRALAAMALLCGSVAVAGAGACALAARAKKSSAAAIAIVCVMRFM